VEKGVEVLTWIRPSGIVAFSASASSFLTTDRCSWSLRILSSSNIPCVKSRSYINKVTTNKLNGRLTIRSTLVCIKSLPVTKWWRHASSGWRSRCELVATFEMELVTKLKMAPTLELAEKLEMVMAFEITLVLAYGSQ